MKSKTVIISNRLGLHARAAARFVQRASQFSSNVELVREDTDQMADGKSILEVLMLAAPIGTRLLIKADGPDEIRALDMLAELVEQKFGEEISDGLF